MINKSKHFTLPAALLACGLALSGCFTETYNRGYVVNEQSLQLVPVGSSQEQVLLVLGTPSSIATIEGDVFYYISQKTSKTAFLAPKIVDQRVLTVYFDKNRKVNKIAEYGQQDGKIFDFISRTTPTSGRETTFIGQVIRGVVSGDTIAPSPQRN